MDIIGPIIVCLIIILICSFCGWCCNRKQTEGTVIAVPQPVTTQPTMPPYHPMADHSTLIGGPVTVPPYPMNNTSMPLPHEGPPVSQPPYPTMTPYPPGPSMYPPPTSTPYPPAGGSLGLSTGQSIPFMDSAHPIGPSGPFTDSAPPYPTNPADIQPPSYSEATAPTSNIYIKQSPYNPNF